MRLSRLLLLWTLACINDSLRYRHYLSRTALPPNHTSAWYSLIHSRDDRSFINVLSLDTRSFLSLYDIFKTQYSTATQCSMRPIDALGLCLYYITGKDSRNRLMQIFNITSSVLGRQLNNGLKALEVTVDQHTDCSISWPTHTEMENYSLLIRNKEPLVVNAWGFVDGVFFEMDNPSTPSVQNAYYNGWKAYCSVSNVLLFTPDGLIRWASINNPGSWHDSHVAQKLYSTLERFSPPGYYIIADSAFRSTDQLVTTMRDNDIGNLENADARALQQAIVRTRQSVEWGNGNIQSVYKRLNGKLKYNVVFNKMLLRIIIRLFNYRSRRVGLNQIRSVFALQQ